MRKYARIEHLSASNVKLIEIGKHVTEPNELISSRKRQRGQIAEVAQQISLCVNDIVGIELYARN